MPTPLCLSFLFFIGQSNNSSSCFNIGSHYTYAGWCRALAWRFILLLNLIFIIISIIAGIGVFAGIRIVSITSFVIVFCVFRNTWCSNGGWIFLGSNC